MRRGFLIPKQQCFQFMYVADLSVLFIIYVATWHEPCVHTHTHTHTHREQITLLRRRQVIWRSTCCKWLYPCTRACIPAEQYNFMQQFCSRWQFPFSQSRDFARLCCVLERCCPLSPLVTKCSDIVKIVTIIAIIIIILLFFISPI